MGCRLRARPGEKSYLGLESLDALAETVLDLSLTETDVINPRTVIAG